MKEIKEWCSRFLESLERHSKEEHVECLYMYSKKVVEDFMRAHKKGIGSSNLRINFISNLVDFGDEFFDTMYWVEHDLKCGHVERKITLKDVGGRRVDCVDWEIHVPPADRKSEDCSKRLKCYEWHYERLCWPWRWWTLREIFNPWNWDTSCSPSYAHSFINIFKNIRTFITPWYKWRRLLLLNVINANGCKLINYSPSFSFMRTRGDSGDIVYYRLKCGIYRATLWRERLVEVKSGEPTTHFMAGLLCAFGKDRKPEDYREEREKVLSGPCLTRRQCERLLGRIVEATPDCGWFGLEG